MLTNAHGWMIPPQYISAEELVRLFRSRNRLGQAGQPLVGCEFLGVVALHVCCEGRGFFYVLFLHGLTAKHSCAHVCRAFGFCMVNRRPLRYHAQEGLAGEIYRPALEE